MPGESAGSIGVGTSVFIAMFSWGGQTQGASPSPPPAKQHRMNRILNRRLSSSRCYVSGDLVNG